MQGKLLSKCLAELVGTYMLVFCGTGAIVINEISGGAVTHIGIAVTFGLIVLGMIYSIGGIYGAHINPAVTIAFWIAKRFPRKKANHSCNLTSPELQKRKATIILQLTHKITGRNETLNEFAFKFDFTYAPFFILIYLLIPVRKLFCSN